MAFAGLWEIWRDEAIADRDAPDAWLRTCTIITTRANDVLAPIHDRMPVMLAEPAWDDWLDPTNADVPALESLLVPAPDDWLEVYPVSTRVNKPDNNDASLIERVDVDAPQAPTRSLRGHGAFGVPRRDHHRVGRAGRCRGGHVVRRARPLVPGMDHDRPGRARRPGAAVGDRDRRHQRPGAAAVR